MSVFAKARHCLSIRPHVKHTIIIIFPYIAFHFSPVLDLPNEDSCDEVRPICKQNSVSESEYLDCIASYKVDKAIFQQTFSRSGSLTYQ